MVLAVFPGSFDPPTYGHLSVIEHVSSMFDSIDVAVAVNPEKKYLFSAEERVQMLSNMVKKYKNVTVHVCNTLTVDYAKNVGASVLVRGVRNATDFAYEFDLSLINHSLNSSITTVFIPTDQNYVTVKSSSIKELARFGGDISKMVPPDIEKAIKQKYKNL